MSFLRNITKGLRSLFRKEQVDRELDEELRAYQEMAAEEKMKDGLSFQSLRSALRKPPFTAAPLEVHTWLRSDIGLISPFVDWLITPIAKSRCVLGKEEFVELALREALSNAMLHGNRMDARKLVHVRCCCEGTKGVFIVVRDQGDGFDSNNVPNPLAVENLDAEHGRGIHLMKLAVDEVSFERGGTEVHIRKKSENDRKTSPPAHPEANRTATC